MGILRVWFQAESSDFPQKRFDETPLVLPVSALVASSLCPGNAKHTMCELDGQIASSG
jgi:hypothetical protein